MAVDEEMVNVSHHVMLPMYNMSKEDSNCIMTSAFIIFTMQTGKDAFCKFCTVRFVQINCFVFNFIVQLLGDTVLNHVPTPVTEPVILHKI